MGGVPTALIVPLDLRDQPTDDLPAVIERAWLESPGYLLTISRRPAKRWTQNLRFARALSLSSAPLYELICWVEPSITLNLPESVVADHRALLDGYHRLFSEEGDSGDYLQHLEGHIHEQENKLYLEIAARMNIERAIKELSYEHRGLEKMSKNLPAAVEAYREGRLEKRDKERLDLDYFHLLEHHLERERDALWPAWMLLSDR